MTNEINEFLERIKLIDPSKYEIVFHLRKLVLETFSDAKEEIKYGGILFSRNDPFGGIFVYTNHVSFEFSFGHKLYDPKKVLEGKGKYRRHLKFKTLSDIENTDFITYLNQDGRNFFDSS